MLTHKFYRICIAFISAALAFQASADNLVNPCSGSSALLNIIDRPTVGDSVCVVPNKQAVLEVGYQYQQLTHSGYAQNFPEAVFRLGLPSDNEFVILLPNYNYQTTTPRAGFGATTLGLKHMLGYTATLTTSVEGLLTLPSGSDGFGSHSLGAAANGVISYTLNPQFSLTFMLGISSQTQSSASGGGRYTSINPDLVLSYLPKEKLLFYVETYAQTYTSPTSGTGANMDTGFVYLLQPHITLDIEIGQRITGSLAGFEHYVGTGAAILF